MPPVWFSESEDSLVSNIISELGDKSGPDNYVSILSLSLKANQMFCVIERLTDCFVTRL